jgi:hypothetical protein
MIAGHVVLRSHLPRSPILGAPERKPSGIPVRHGLWTMVRVVSTDFPPPDAGRDPSAPGEFALEPHDPRCIVSSALGTRNRQRWVRVN